MSLVKNSKLWLNLILFVSIACLMVMLLSLIGVRQEWFSYREAATYIRYSVQVGLAIMALDVLVLVFARKNTTSLVKGIVALLIILVPLLIIKANVPAGTTIFATSRPASTGDSGAHVDPASVPINDISTDTINPPVHVAALPLRPATVNPAEYAGHSVAAAQAAQYPEIKPIHSSLSKEAAFARALEVANDMGWDIIAQDASTGIFEAVASTRFFNFKDDIVVRVTDSDAGSIIDIRSHSRVGRSDLGKNADRINSFINKFGS